jgi:carboxylesterase
VVGITGTEPFSAPGGPLGVLVCHGFTGSPASVRPWAEHLAAGGCTVELPRLPGHGTDWRELTLTTWEDWYWEVERTFEHLRARCDTVVAMGLSMGGTLVTHLAAQAGAGPGGVDGLVLVNPSFRGDRLALRAVPVLKRVIPSVRSIGNDIERPGYDEIAYPRVPTPAIASLTALWRVVQDELPRVTQPVLVFKSTVDNVVGPASLELFRRKVGSDEVRVETLHRSRHVATLDHDADLIHQRSLEFARRLAERRSAGRAADQPTTTEPHA